MRKLWMVALALAMAWTVPTWACGGGCGPVIAYQGDRIMVEGPNQSWYTLKIVDWSEDRVTVELPADLAEKVWDGRLMELRLTPASSPGSVEIHWPKIGKMPAFSNQLPVDPDIKPWMLDFAMAHYPKAIVDHEMQQVLWQHEKDRQYGRPERDIPQRRP